MEVIDREFLRHVAGAGTATTAVTRPTTVTNNAQTGVTTSIFAQPNGGSIVVNCTSATGTISIGLDAKGKVVGLNGNLSVDISSCKTTITTILPTGAVIINDNGTIKSFGPDGKPLSSISSDQNLFYGQAGDLVVIADNGTTANVEFAFSPTSNFISSQMTCGLTPGDTVNVGDPGLIPRGIYTNNK